MKAYNFPNMLEKEWMLITAGSDQKVNTMTAGWGLWNFMGETLRLYFCSSTTLYL